MSYTLTFQDEFSGTALDAWRGHGSEGRWTTSFSPHLDDTRWLASNGEGQYYVDPDDPDLPRTITAANGSVAIHAVPLTPAQQALAGGQPYASGVLTTELTFGAEGGYVEISARVPDQQGFLSAFWLLPTDGDWSDEIDVFEILGHDTDTVHTNLWDDGVGASQAIQTADMADGFHTYGLHWTAETITWFIDGVAVRTSPNTVDEEMYLAIGLAVDTTWTGAPDATTDFSDGLLVDWVRVYEETDSPTRNPAALGDDTFTNYRGYELGTDGEDALYGTRWADFMSGGSGDDVLHGRKGHDQLDGGSGDDELFGQKGRDVLLGGAGDDKLIGGKGRDVLQGGAGKDHLWGGKWAADGKRDVFVFEPGGGKDFVHDFEVGIDVLDLTALSTSWAAVSAALQDQGWAAYVNLGHLGADWSDMVWLKGVDVADLTADDFLF
ncbi:MAG: family 16 glycosylhydrolase [Shimia sp.]